MRNLKRVLSLALAVIMVIGMMVMGAGAAEIKYENLTDKAEIKNSEAVATLVSLGVVNGRTDGSFDPNGIVTRAEMAKMIAICLNGGKDPLLGSNSTTTKFTDTKGHWAEPYIAYCYNLGIVDGLGDGTFAPDRAVTGTEAAKMFLTALGYRSDIEGLVGSEWSSKTDALANKVGLYDELNVDVSLGLSRDNTAQLIYNGIQAYEVKYTNLEGQYDNIIYASEWKHMLSYRFGVVRVEAIVTGTEELSINAKPMKEGKTKVVLLEDCYYGDATDTVVFNVSTTMDMLGQKVVMYVKPVSKLSPNPADDVVLGDAILAKSNVVVTTTGKYGFVPGKDTLAHFAADKDLTLAASTIYSYNYGLAGSFNSSSTSGNGIETILVDYDRNTVVDYAFQLKTSFGEVTTKTTKDDGSIRITGLADTDYTAETTIGFEDVERGDYVNYVEINNFLYVMKAESVQGKMTIYDADKKSYISVDGKKYNTSAITADTGAIDPVVTAATYCADTNLEQEALFYLDTCGNIIAVGDVKAASQFAFVTAVDTTSIDGETLDTANKAKAVLSATGETAIKTVFAVDADADGVEVGEIGDSAVANKLYGYTVNGENKYILSGNYSETNSTAVKITKGKTTIDVGGTAYYADENTAYFYLAPKGTYVVASNTISGITEYDSVVTYTGYANAPSFEATTDYVLVTDAVDTSLVKAIVVVTDTAGLANNLMFLYSYVGTNDDGVVFDVVMDGEVVKNVTITEGATKASKNVVGKYTETKNGYVFSALGSNVVSGNIDRLGDTTIVVADEEYELTAKSVIANIDGRDTTTEGVALVKGDYVTIAFDGTDNTIKAVYVLTPYAANNAEILNVSGNAGWSAIVKGKATYTGSASDDMTDDLIISYGAAIAVYSTKTDNGDGTYSYSGDVASLVNATTYYVVVTSQDGSTQTAYEVTASIS